MSYSYDYGSQSQYGGAYGDSGTTGMGMYDDDGYGAGGGEDYLDETITQEDCWTVIAAYFADKTLVSQQIDSFNEFVNTTMQELVDESGSLILDQNMQHSGKAGDATVSLREGLRLLSSLPSGKLIANAAHTQKRYELKFEQIYLSKPTQTEADGTVAPMFPNEARLRNLTCVPSLLCPLLSTKRAADFECRTGAATRPRCTSMSRSACWCKSRTSLIRRRASWCGRRRRTTMRRARRKRFTLGRCVAVDREAEERRRADPDGTPRPQVPIMLQSDFCILENLEEKDKLELNECPYDKVRPASPLRQPPRS